jgi:hypothetical protein
MVSRLVHPTFSIDGLNILLFTRLLADYLELCDCYVVTFAFLLRRWSSNYQGLGTLVRNPRLRNVARATTELSN